MDGPNFSEDEIKRYARNILLPEIGGIGQDALRAARVLIIGAGGLGCPVLLYLAAAGVGTIGLADDDIVEVSNLQRQIAHGTADVGISKVQSGLAAARAINPLIRLVPHAVRVTADDADALIAGYDIVCDGTDNFATRAVVAATCRRLGKTLVSAAATRFEGQLTIFPPATLRPEIGCYRCLYPEPAPPGVSTQCAEAGVLGAMTGVMGSLQAVEVLKCITGAGEPLAGQLLIWDALAVRAQVISLVRDPACPFCGQCGDTPSSSAPSQGS